MTVFSCIYVWALSVIYSHWLTQLTDLANGWRKALDSHKLGIKVVLWNDRDTFGRLSY